MDKQKNDDILEMQDMPATPVVQSQSHQPIVVNVTNQATANATTNAPAVQPGFSWSALLVNFLAFVVLVLLGGALIIPVFIYWLVCAVQAGNEGRRRGKTNQWIWGFLLGPIGLIIVML